MRKIAIITARSGSKGLPHKNVLPLEGKPVLAYSIEAALDSGCFDRIVLSTDSQEYIDLFSHYPIEFILRKEELASDKATSYQVIEDVLIHQGYGDCDYFVLLQPTSPLRTAVHTREVCELFESNYEQFDYLVSVHKSNKPTVLIHPIDEDKTMKYFNIDYSTYRRQNYPQEYSPNGAFFVAKAKEYLEQKHFYGAKSLSYEMDDESSIDVDTQIDLDQIALILRRRNTDSRSEKVQRTLYNKSPLFGQYAEVTLLGDSLCAGVHLSYLGDKSLLNLGVEDITLDQCLSLIIESGKLSYLGQYTILLFNLSTRGIRLEDNTDSILEVYQSLINACLRINPETQIFVGTIPPSSFTVDRDNKAIALLNTRLSELLVGASVVDLYSSFVDQYDKLKPQFGLNGVDLSTLGYAHLVTVIQENLSL